MVLPNKEDFITENIPQKSVLSMLPDREKPKIRVYGCCTVS